MKRGNNNSADFELHVDNDAYFRFVLNTDSHGEPGGCATINLQLTAGQIIRVDNEISTLLYGTDELGIIHSYFTGYMLYAL